MRWWRDWTREDEGDNTYGGKSWEDFELDAKDGNKETLESS